MNRQNVCVAAILSMALVAWGQEQKDERVEVRVVGPTGSITTMEPVELEIDGLDVDSAVGSLILGVEGMPQDADEKGAKKKVRLQDADKDGTIVKEIDLGDGRTMRIVISTKKGEPKTKTWFGSTAEPHVFHVPDMKLREKTPGHEGMKGFTVFGGEMSPFTKEFKLEGFGSDVKEELDRAMRAFDRARDEFIRAYKESAKEPKEKRPAPEMKRMRIGKPEARVIIGKGEAEKEAEADDRNAKAKAEIAESHEKQVEKLKAKMEEELKRTEQKVVNEQVGKLKEDLKRERDEAKARRGAVQWVDTAPGASTKGEIESLRREIKELEKMVRELREQLDKK
jgi:hypothetical protein